jgi:hypothetical protein
MSRKEEAKCDAVLIRGPRRDKICGKRVCAYDSTKCLVHFRYIREQQTRFNHGTQPGVVEQAAPFVPDPDPPVEDDVIEKGDNYPQTFYVPFIHWDPATFEEIYTRTRTPGDHAEDVKYDATDSK